MNPPSLVDRIIERLEAWRGQTIAWRGLAPNGWRVYLTDQQLQDIRIRKKRPYVTVEDIERCITSPTAIYLDVREASNGRTFWVLRQITDPYGHDKLKFFSVDIKRSRKLLFIRAYFVSTAHKLDRFRSVKAGRRIWPKAETS